MITTVVFDLDDTLYDEADYCKSGFTAVAEYLAEKPDWPGGERIFEGMWGQFRQGNRGKVFNAAFDELGLKYDKNIIAEAVKIYRNHNPEITLPAESERILGQLSGKYTLAMLTDGFLPAQKLKVKALGIEKYFKSIVYTEELGREFWKPSCAGFEKIISSLNAKPQECVYIADNEKKDFIGPNKLGFLTIQLIRATKIHTESCEESFAKPQHIIHALGELSGLLAKL